MRIKIPIRDGLRALVSEHPGCVRRRDARHQIAAGCDAAAVWAAAICRPDATDAEIRDTAEAIAWQGVSGAEAFRAACREEARAIEAIYSDYVRDEDGEWTSRVTRVAARCLVVDSE